MCFQLIFTNGTQTAKGSDDVDDFWMRQDLGAVDHQQSFIWSPADARHAHLFGDVFIGCNAAEVYEVLEDGVDFAGWPQCGQLRQLDVAGQNPGHQGRHTIFERLQLHIIRSLGPRLVDRNQFGVVRIHRCLILRGRHKSARPPSGSDQHGTAEDSIDEVTSISAAHRDGKLRAGQDRRDLQSRYLQRTGYFISVSERYAQINRRRARQRWNDDGLEILE